MGGCATAAAPPRSRRKSNARARLRTRRFSTRIMRHILRSSLVLLLAACSMRPPYERPQVELPAAWKEAAPRFAEDGRWWRIYRDQELDKVIEEAFAGNADLVIAATRVDEARALVAEAESFFFPRVDEQVELTRRTVLLREEALGLQRKRRDAGVISEFDLRQLEAETAAVRAQLPPLQREREREEAALSVLLGRTPKQVFESGITVRLSFDEQPEAAVVPSGLPSELLLRRPDLVQAERGLAAANARLAVARAEMFPSIALTAALGSESAALSNLFKSGAGVGALAASVAQPIFAGGRLEAQSAAAQARERAALAGYQQAIRNAFRGIPAALLAQSRSRESYDAQNARAPAPGGTPRLARLRYQNGVASQLDVIDAERGLLAASVSRIEALRAHRAAVADLFRALGG